MVKIIPYNPKLKPLANKLRKNMTPGEVLLWNELKGDKFWGLDFDRQRCIDNYIVDFYNKNLLLAIEVDGFSHLSEYVFDNDMYRQKRLEELGVTVLRFHEHEVRNDILNVLRSIESTVIGLISDNPEIVLPATFDENLLKM